MVPPVLDEVREKITSPWLVLATVMVGTLLIGLDRTVVNLALPEIINEFGLTITLAGWISTAYIISNAVFVPVFGKLGDMFGNKRIYFWSFIGFIVISVFAGMSWDFNSLVVFRVLQGLVGAAVYPTAMSLIVKHFHEPKKRAHALGIWSASMASSAAIGPLIGGYLIDNFSWRAIFYINLPLGIIGLIMLVLFLKNDEPEKVDEKFDYFGAIILSVAITSVVLVLEQGQDWGWTSFASILSYLTAIVSSFMFFTYEKKVESPIIDFRFFHDKNFVMILLVSFLSFGAMMGSMFLLPLFAQTILGYTAIKTGYLFVPMALMMIISSPIGAMLANKFGLRVPIVIGVLIASFSMYLFSITVDPTTTLTDLDTPLVILAVGLGFIMSPLANGITSIVANNEVGIASGIYNLVRNVAGAFGIAIFGSVLTSNVKSNFYSLSLNTVVNTHSPEILKTIPVLMMLKAQVMSYSDVFVIGSIMMFLAFIAALFLKANLKKKNDGTFTAHGE